MAGRQTYTPLDVACPICRALPERHCHSMVLPGRPLLRRPHAERVLAARTAQQHRELPRVPAGVTDAWTCSSCGRSYWPPREWEPELWPLLRRVLQDVHGQRHVAEVAAETRP